MRRLQKTHPKPFRSAEDFLAELEPRGPLYGPADRPRSVRDRWLFRGQGDAAHPLLPTALREDARQATYLAQVRLEFAALRLFYEKADARGLELPEDSQLLRARFEGIGRALEWAGKSPSPELKEVLEQWPPPELHSLLALAQHHGIKTRLLDWTRNPYVAAYFAARSAIEYLRRGSRPKELGVWVLSRDAMRRIRSLHAPGASRGSRLGTLAEEITVPRSANPNLHAQEGLFVLSRQSASEGETAVETEDIAQLVEKQFAVERLRDRPAVLFTLPAEQASRLLRLLHAQGIDGAVLFPNYDGVVRALAERSLWDIPQNELPWPVSHGNRPEEPAEVHRGRPDRHHRR